MQPIIGSVCPVCGENLVGKPNINKAMLNLDWWPVVDRQTGLSETIKYFKSVL